mgnify:CR=1 FL=1
MHETIAASSADVHSGPFSNCFQTFKGLNSVSVIFNLILVCFGFWFGEVRSIVLAYNLGMLMISGQYIPIRLFPESVLAIINWTPLIYLVDFPVSTAVGLFSFNEWIYNFGISIIWCLIVTLVSFFIYSRGVSRYEAYGQ